MFDSGVPKISLQAMSRTLALFMLKLFHSSSLLLRRLGFDIGKWVQNWNAGYEVKCIKDIRCDTRNNFPGELALHVAMFSEG